MKKILFSVVLLLVFCIQFADCKSITNIYQEFTKEIKKTFDISADAAIEIKNKYGSVDIKTGTTNRVEFNIQIIVQAGNKSDADKLLKEINVEFNADEDDVSAVTKINTSSTWWERWFSSNDAEYEINYTVSVPKTISLDLTNKYGNTTIGSLDNDLDVDIKYGNLILETVNGDLDLSLGYGKLTANRIGNADIEVKYSDNLTIKSAGNLDIESKYSKIFIDEAEDCDIESKYDEYTLGTIGNLDNSGRYDEFNIKNLRSIDLETAHTKFKIGNLERSGDFIAQYGSIEIQAVSPAFTEIDFECQYTDVILGILHPFKLDLESAYSNVDLPASFKGDKEKDGNETSIEGYIGDGNSNSVVMADMRYGSFSIKN